MRKGPKAVLWAVVLALAAATVIQWAGAFGGEEPAADAKRMLYEASLFQVELMSGYTGEAARAASTGDLNGLKQAAYSADYTHARLAKALGGRVPELRSASALMELIIRLQIGGERPLKPEEAEALAEAAPYFAELHDAYAALMDEGGAVNAGAAERLRQADKEIADRLGRENR
ncbi:S-adenosylmethionine decarboxylase [Paenibacillus sp.]|uniref:S-adenosylmethionine decarboxylase n=1 Tax=Paenibacillus sp. TaxID=58172 RepID=UPI002D5CF912|nr:S-adenosylmethionine decarboxylase [Paenibacillus sp.]HZG87076.1 S-adenosylmethionine decarboxylase [Paenibacillus sp.]